MTSRAQIDGMNCEQLLEEIKQRFQSKKETVFRRRERSGGGGGDEDENGREGEAKTTAGPNSNRRRSRSKVSNTRLANG